MTFLTVARRRLKNGILTVSAVLLVVLLLSACGGDPQTQQRANTSKTDLDRLITQAQSIGVPNTLLAPIIQQESQIGNTNAPLTIFSDQPATDYYSNVAQRYQMLAIQVQGMETQVTQQFDYQAALDIQDLENVLAQRQAQNFVEAKTFAIQLTQYQDQLSKAQYPRDYTQISNNAKQSTLALQLLEPAYNNIASLQADIKQERRPRPGRFRPRRRVRHRGGHDLHPHRGEARPVHAERHPRAPQRPGDAGADVAGYDARVLVRGPERGREDRAGPDDVGHADRGKGGHVRVRLRPVLR